MHYNSAKKLEVTQTNFDNWLNNMGMSGDSIVAFESINQELKHVLTMSFTSRYENNDNSNKEKFNPRFLLVASGLLDLDWTCVE